ncbi:MAG: hypothetical protein ACFFER_00100 [Candidatus Thorarchaeota archaeon]
MSECPICGRPNDAGDRFCQYHQLAADNLRKGFDNWTNAMDTDWDSFLDHVYATEGAGRWVREVIEHIKSEDSSSE